jgi:hypothetical protein
MRDEVERLVAPALKVVELMHKGPHADGYGIPAEPIIEQLLARA